MSKQDEINEKLKRLDQINKERPCSECKWHKTKNRYFTCGAATGTCNFNHDHFERDDETTTKLADNLDKTE